ncbi:DUF4144 family protein [Vibrio sp. AND4]|uniref:DUF4144 family protein n=1 Tax=Vibrio sp. AND4 TaxID=314289 RepID=UPI00015F040B|nr:DUF4144 family protein [Vibrio sp. AND4]EDP57786.1 hypothetical protein AND4_11824 [Vibrio sp. AND4]
MIVFPCLLKLDGVDELIYLDSQAELNKECVALIWEEKDFIIDTEGACYTLRQQGVNKIIFEKQLRTFSVTEVTELIQAHKFSQAQTCIIKIHFSSIKQAIEALASQHSSQRQ